MSRLLLLWLLTGCAVVDGDKDGIPIDLDPDTAEPAGDCALGAVLSNDVLVELVNYFSRSHI